MDLHPKYNDVRTVIEQSPRPEVEAFQIYLDLKYGKSWKLVNVNYIFDLEMCVVQAKKHGGDDFTTFVPFSSSQKWSMHQ
ncbi:hypothetical protein BKA69DRAFT_1122814 [Paraphysoderma sedebokerense]|nr:hypothetical protein BKA69DRAFT_1122814 [Paraphysoderma sedebokerense]